MVVSISKRGMAINSRRKGIGPVHGPYAEVWFDEVANTYRIRLTDEGREKVREFLERYPHPIALLKRTFSGTYQTAKQNRLTEEEIDAICMEGMAFAVARYDPTRGAAMSTVVAFGLRGAVCDAIRKAQKDYLFFSDDYTGNMEKPSRLEPESTDANIALRYLNAARLTNRERAVLEMKFGLGDYPEPMNIVEIAAAVGLTKQRIQQLQEAAIRKIRDRNGLDAEWAKSAREGVIGYLRKHSEGSLKPDICKGARIPVWQFREVIPLLLSEGMVCRERKLISHLKWRLVYQLKQERAA